MFSNKCNSLFGREAGGGSLAGVPLTCWRMCVFVGNVFFLLAYACVCWHCFLFLAYVCFRLLLLLVVGEHFGIFGDYFEIWPETVWVLTGFRLGSDWVPFGFCSFSFGF